MAEQPIVSIALAVMLLFVAVATIYVDGGNSNDKHGSSKEHMLKSKEEDKVDLVVEACKNITRDMLVRNGKTHFEEETCISLLRSDNRTKAAKDHGDLVLVALDLLERRSNEVALKVESILGGLKVHNWTEHAFGFCSADYALIVRLIPVCRNIFVDLKPLGKRAERTDATIPLQCLDSLGQAANDCYLKLVNKDWNQTEEFENIIMHISLPFGLMEIALDYEDESKW